MTAQEYLNTYQGQSLLYAPSPAREYLRGQCVQAVCFYVTANGHPVEWADAYYWRRLADQYPDQYEWIDNTTSAVPQPNDIIIWNTALAGSGGSGHIAVCLSANFNNFVSVDQNWGGKTVHAVTHNYNQVAGWLRFRSAAPAQAPAPAPAAAVTSGGDEMIANADQAHKAYQLLRPNGGGSLDEINATAGKRSWIGFANDAQGEVAARNAAIKGQADQLGNMQGIINNQNATITDLTTKLTDSATSAQEKQAALTEALTKIASDNADMATAHDTILDLNKMVDGFQNNPVVKAQQKAAELTKAPSNVGKLLASLFSAFGKFNKKK